MVIYLKESKLDKVDVRLFTPIAVSQNEIKGTVTNMSTLLPPANIFQGRVDGSVSKKKFAKKYAKFLNTENTYTEWFLLKNGACLANGDNIAFVCTDEEFEIGYIKQLAEKIGELFGCEVQPLKEAKRAVEEALDSYEKKERKYFNSSESELSEKGEKVVKKMTKKIKKSLASSVEETDEVTSLQNRFAIDEMALALMGGDNPVVELNKDETAVKSINASNCEIKTKDIIGAIMAPKEENIGSFVKSVVKANGFKYKEEKLKEDLDKEGAIALLMNIYLKLADVRSGKVVVDDE